MLTWRRELVFFMDNVGNNKVGLVMITRGTQPLYCYEKQVENRSTITIDTEKRKIYPMKRPAQNLLAGKLSR